MKKFWEEFKKFISKGNVVDLAIAVIIGAAFNKIVSSLVNDIIMPLISCAVGGKDVSDWKWVIKPAEYDELGNVTVAETALKYGAFIQTIIDFLIIAFTLFIIFKIVMKAKSGLDKLGKGIVDETKKLAKKNKKHKKGEVESETVEVESVETTEVNAKSAENANKNIDVKDTAKEEQEQVLTSDTATSKEDWMIELLTEIRDSLKTNKK